MYRIMVSVPVKYSNAQKSNNIKILFRFHESMYNEYRMQTERRKRKKNTLCFPFMANFYTALTLLMSTKYLTKKNSPKEGKKIWFDILIVYQCSYGSIWVVVALRDIVTGCWLVVMVFDGCIKLLFYCWCSSHQYTVNALL